MGVDYRLYRPFARSRRGVKVYQKVSGSRTGRANVMALYGGNSGDKLLAPFCFEGSCDTNIINAYFETQVLKDASLLPENSVIVLDNAAFHKGSRLQEIVEKAGHTLLFLPPYSPDLNPIEKKWAQVKSFIRSFLSDVLERNKFDAICSGVANFA
jgi:hypothetical protein